MKEEGFNLPEPFGKPLTPELWQNVFSRIQRLSPDLNLYDGRQDIGSRMIHLTAVKKNSATLIIDELTPNVTDELIARRMTLLVRTQYYESGLHQRISFHARIVKKVIHKNYPSLVMQALPPICKVSSLFITLPSKDKPINLEIPIEGAPPMIRVIEMSLERIKAYTPNATQLLPQSRKVNGVRVDFVDLGSVLVDVEISASGRDTTDIKLSKLPPESGKVFDSYFEQEFSSQFDKKHEQNEGAVRREVAPVRISTAMANLPAAVVVLKDEVIRRRISGILQSFDWNPRVYDSFDQPDAGVLREARALVLDVQQGPLNSVDFIIRLIAENVIIPTQFALIGDDPTAAKPELWAELGDGLFLPASAPYPWMKQKLEGWLKVTDKSREKSDTPPRGSILVIDDSLEFVDMLGILLSKHNYKVATAGMGRDGMRQAHRIKPDLILLDIDLPDISGLEILHALRSFHVTRDIPVIMVTGHSDASRVREALTYGIKGYLIKPFDEQELLQRVEEVLGKN